jgi:hypothetical protein
LKARFMAIPRRSIRLRPDAGANSLAAIMHAAGKRF